MEILVCMKQVPDDSVEIRLGADGTPDLSHADPQGNAFDTYAQELAVRYVEANGGTVSVLTVGAEEDKICLKNALAVGAANAYHISTDGVSAADASVTANLLAAGIRRIQEEKGSDFDLILCGRESTDYIGGELGEMLGEKLGLPFVTDVVEVREEEGVLKLKKELDAGYLILDASVPAVLTVSKPDYDPRYPTIKSKLAARKVKIPSMQIGEFSLAENDLSPKVTYLGVQEPPKREAGIKIQEDDPAEAVAKLFGQLAADKVL
ncbi:MAG: electron transfer flavoprotein subunit beta/FixA family protein [Eubacterium sp.]|nr:electron transfer flavoprotein subunit beta/FixA family protein [Eubacterium sp.]